jgi:hypothetical protein
MIFNYLFKKLKSQYLKIHTIVSNQNETTNDLIESQLESFTELKTRHDGILRDKIELSQQHKELKAYVRKLEADGKEFKDRKYVPQEDYNGVVERLQRAQAAIGLIGRIGILRGDVFRNHCMESYKLTTMKYMEAVGKTLIPILMDRVPNVTDEQRASVHEVADFLTTYSKQVIDDSQIIQTLVEEMFVMAEDYYERRGEYLLSGGPVPMARVDTELLNGDGIKTILQDLLKNSALSKNQRDTIVAHTTNLLTFPLASMVASINQGESEKMIATTGCIIYNIQSKEADFDVNFVIPMISQMELQNRTTSTMKHYLE